MSWTPDVAKYNLEQCSTCLHSHGRNGGMPHMFHRTDSDAGGYYPAHVRCEQCGHDGPGADYDICGEGDELENAEAARLWNEEQRRKEAVRAGSLVA